VYYNFDNNTDIKLCETNFGECVKNTNKTTIFVKSASLDYLTVLEDNKITISNDAN
jgi:hypothetical protein